MKVRTILTLFLSLISFQGLFAQVEVSLSTDKLKYEYGESIYLNVAASNPTLDTIELFFRGARQVDCFIDNICFDNIDEELPPGAGMEPETIFIVPGSYFSWQFTYPQEYRQHLFPEPGFHTISANVAGYGSAEPVEIEVVLYTALDQDQSDLLSIGQNYPNPFNDITYLSFSLFESAEVRVSVYNSKAQLVKVVSSKKYAPGYYRQKLDLSGQPAGDYTCIFQLNSQLKTIRLLKTSN